MSPLDVVCAVIQRNGKILAAKRRPGGPTGGKWEFPGGKVKNGETPEQAVCREVAEELGCTVAPLRRLKPNLHEYPQFSVLLLPIICELESGEPNALEHVEIKWLQTDELPRLDWSDADEPILSQLPCHR